MQEQREEKVHTSLQANLDRQGNQVSSGHIGLEKRREQQD
jgi:hypothetical protein